MLVKFNTEKQKLIIPQKLNKPVHAVYPPLHMNQCELQEVTTHRHMGIAFCQKRAMAFYIDFVVDRAYRRLNIMRNLV